MAHLVEVVPEKTSSNSKNESEVYSLPELSDTDKNLIAHTLLQYSDQESQKDEGYRILKGEPMEIELDALIAQVNDNCCTFKVLEDGKLRTD